MDEHPSMPKSLPSGNKKAIKGYFQPDSVDHWFPVPLHDPMQLFFSLLYK
jgi:hypothetical protein